MTLLELARRAETRIWVRVDRRGPDECWPWKGSPNTSGYGQVDLTYKGVRCAHNVHRVIWALAHGRSPGRRFVRHTCHNRICCNPAHLRLGTPLQNSRDMIAAGRSTAGDRNPNARLTAEQVHGIRSALAAGETQASVARRHGVSCQAVNHIATGRRWSHVA